MTKIPIGCRIYSGPKAESMEEARNTFLKVFSAFGYKVFCPSTIQLVSSCWSKLPSTIREKLLVLNTPHGEAACLRPDLTLTAISYISSHYAPQERPLRICYADRIFLGPEEPETNLERLQLGAELIGWDGSGADVEVISIMFKVLDLLGHRDAQVVIGDTNIIDFMLKNTVPNIAKSLRDALLRQSLAEYYNTLEKHPVPDIELSALLALPTLKGKRSILNKAESLLPKGTPLSDIKHIISTLEKMGYGERVSVDLALSRKLNYYSGPVFEVYSPRAGKLLGGGGRYDSLLSSYGIIGQAIGFALDLEEIALVKETKIGSNSIMIWSGKTPPEVAMTRADLLTDKGFNVELSWTENRQHSIDLAKRRKYKWWLNALTSKIYDLEEKEEHDLIEWLGKEQETC